MSERRLRRLLLCANDYGLNGCNLVYNKVYFDELVEKGMKK